MLRNRLFAVTAAIVFVGGSALTAGARPATSRLVGARPTWATPARFVRPVDTDVAAHFAVVLGWRHADQLTRLASAVSDPSNPSYGHFLSPAAFRARFAPPRADVAAVRGWLRSQGFHLGATPLSGLFVPADGTVGQVERAFGIHMGMYRTGGATRMAPDADPSVPGSLAGIVRGVIGLDGATARPASAPYRPPVAFLPGRPCSTYWGERTATTFPKAYGAAQPFVTCGYTPAQLQAAYGLSPAIAAGTDGTGVTVAVVDAYASPWIVSDLATYSRLHGLPAPDLTQVVATPHVPHHEYGKPRGWNVEETIDLDAVHTMAPGASLVFEAARSASDVDLDTALLDVIDHARATIVTNSYGSVGEQLPPALIATEESIYEAAALQGVGVYFSSGDCGDEIDPQGDCYGAGYRTVDWPASSPFVTAVGGTSIGIGASDDYLFETAWGNAYANYRRGAWRPAPPGPYSSGGGGGTSTFYDEPIYQQDVVPTALADVWGNGPHRVEPDVAIDGNPNTGLLIGERQTFPDGTERYAESRWGGTSLSSPLFAGVMAVAEQAAGRDLGFANPLLYGLAGSSAFNDVAPPATTIAGVRADWNDGADASAGRSFSLATFDQTGTLTTTAGYDDATGLGSPNGGAFIQAIG